MYHNYLILPARSRIKVWLLALLLILGGHKITYGQSVTDLLKIPDAKEQIELRSRNSKHFQLPDGRSTAVFSSGSLHYYNGSQWLPIDNTLVESISGGRKVFKNFTNSFNTFFPSDPFVKSVRTALPEGAFYEKIFGIQILNKNGKLLLSLKPDKNIQSGSVGNVLTYYNVFPGVDLKYTLGNDGRKMEFVIRDGSIFRSLPTGSAYVRIVESLTLPVNSGVRNISGQNILYLNGKSAGVLNALRMVDSNGESTEEAIDVKQTFSSGTDKGLKTELQVYSDFSLNWITNYSRKFPIVLDPSFSFGPYSLNNSTGYSSSLFNLQNGSLRIGGTNYYAWAKFDTRIGTGLGAILIDSIVYSGYQFSSGVSPSKIVKVVDLDTLNPNNIDYTNLSTTVGAKPNISPNYVFAGAAPQWRTARLSSSFQTSFASAISRGYATLGFGYLSGSNSPSEQYGNNSSTQACFLQVYYTQPPCTNPVTAGITTGPASVCGGTSGTFYLNGASTGAGMNYQWQTSLNGTTFTDISGANSFYRNQGMSTDSMYIRCKISCAAGTPVYSSALKVLGGPKTISSTSTYSEGFENLPAENTLPACVSTTGLGIDIQTFTSAQPGPYFQKPNSGSGFASYTSFTDNFLYFSPVKLDSGVLYSFTTWYITDGGYGGWDSLSICVGNQPVASSMIRIPGATVKYPTDTVYTKLYGTFRPSVSGVYWMAIRLLDTSGEPYYLSIDDILIKLPAAPTVRTTAKKYLTNNSVTLSGTITNGGSHISVSGIVYGLSANPVKGGAGVSNIQTSVPVDAGAFSLNLSSLTASTTYHFRTYATNEVGTSYGPDSVFTTLASAVVPSVSNLTRSQTTDNSTVISVDILSNGGAPISASGIIYGTTRTLTVGGAGVSVSNTSPVIASGNFSRTLLSLVQNTKYYYRSFATNSAGTGYGNLDSFVTAKIINVLPYLQNFDTAGITTGWTTSALSGTANDWTLGTPNKPDTRSAFSGNTCWATKTFNYYSDNQDAVLISPRFDFSSQTNDPVVRFYHLFKTEWHNDWGVIEMDTGTGNWFILDQNTGTSNYNTLVSQNWYNDYNFLSDPVWTGSSLDYGSYDRPWIKSETKLTRAAGKSNVRFRFRFISDASSTAIGWLIDNVEVVQGCSGIISPGTVTGPASICYDENGVYTLTGSPTSGGIFYQWEESTDGVTYYDISDENDSRLNYYISEDSVYLRCKLTCYSSAPVYTAPVKVFNNFFNVTSTSNFSEGFESLTIANSIPSCWYADSLGSKIRSFITTPAGSGNRKAKTGSKFMAFNPGANNEMIFTKAVDLKKDVIYSFTVWYITDGGVSSWDSLCVSASYFQVPHLANTLQYGKVINPRDTVYTKLAGMFVPPSTGKYYLGVKAKAGATAVNLSIDDILIKVCTPPTILTSGKSSITATTAVLSGSINGNGGLPVTENGFVYGTIRNLTIGGAGVSKISSNPVVQSGAYSLIPTGLQAGAKIYYRAFASNVSGTNYGNIDSFTTLPPVSVFPYFQNFDGAANDWTTYSVNGGANDWVCGTPAKVEISNAYSGTKCWITKATGLYSNNANAVIESPVFNFSTFVNDPILSFYQAFQFDEGFDGGRLEISVDGGVTWSVADNQLANPATRNTRFSAGWYNSDLLGAASFENAWTGFSTPPLNSGWIYTQTRLMGLAGQTNVKIRFHYTTDPPDPFGPSQQEGWAIDNIQIREVNAPTLNASGVTVNRIGRDTCWVKWNKGNGEARIVVAALSTSPVIAPIDSNEYGDYPIFGSPVSLTGPGNQVVYNGSTQDSTRIMNLTPGLTYRFTVYEYNGSLMHTRYKTPGASATGTTLPVKLLNFTGIKKGDDVLLNWTTAEEINNRGFEIERSFDGISFETIGFVKGVGNSVQLTDYDFTDSKPFGYYRKEKLYYRLKQIDLDQKSAYSKIISVNINEAIGFTVGIFPNPISSDSYISIAGAKSDEIGIEIFDLSGNKINEIRKETLLGKLEMQISEFLRVQSGMYFLKVTSGNDTVVIKVLK